MNISTVNLFKIHSELTTASAPLICTCVNNTNTFGNYYLKFVLDENEYCGLVYEIICNQLALYMQINAPDIAFAEVGQGIEENEKIRRNHLLKPDSICFASKEINPHKMVSDLDAIRDKTTFNLYNKPEDFLKIALFDLWVANDDRNGINYNLLTETTDKLNFYAIDHYHCFGGGKNFNSDFSAQKVDQYKSILTTSFGISLKKYLENPSICVNIVDKFRTLDLDEVTKIIHHIFLQLPKNWKIDPNLERIIVSLLTNKHRNDQVIDTFKQLF